MSAISTTNTGIRSVHKLYQKFAPKWKRTRDAVEGGDAIRECAAEYLARLKDQDAGEYRAYYSRPAFFEASGRTKEALAGLVFARSPVVKLPAEFDKIVKDIDLAGGSLDQFATSVVDEMLETGFVLGVVNHNGNPANPGTRAAPSGRPYLRYYIAESIMDWRTRAINGVTELSFLKVREIAELPGVDEFSIVCEERFRVFDLEPGTKGGYRQRLFREVIQTTANGVKETTLELLEEHRPVVNGTRWQVIPAVLVSLNGKPEPGPVPLLPIAETNIAHWRKSCDLEHGAHFTALPTPYITGGSLPKGQSLRIGSSDAIVIDAPDAELGYLEFSGAGLGTLITMIANEESRMAALGARMLAPEKAQPESGAAQAIRRGGEAGALIRVSKAVSAAITKLLQLMAVWEGANPDEVSFVLNTLFVDEKLEAAEITALLSTWQAGGMSKDSLIDNLARGGRLPEGRTVEEEIEQIEIEPPALGTLGGPFDPFAPPPLPNGGLQ